MAKGRVLLAHGNADCQRIFGSALTFDGYDVETVSDGDSALQRLGSRPFEVVVTDLYLESSGDECLLRAIRATAFTAHLPVVVVTAWTTEPHQRVAARERADAFLPLPVRPRELLEVLAPMLVQPRGLLVAAPSPPNDWSGVRFGVQ